MSGKYLELWTPRPLMSVVVEKRSIGSVVVRQEEKVFPGTYPALQKQEKEPGVL